ncbi:MAG: F0F1 ATP synthase subunit delta [Candidatus Nomurabacteria bacterium]|nr:F0F1 ATP synthase subunit delta [Candidatus Nomurabacteria bacterium]
MATISINNLARAIYESSHDKDEAELDAVMKNAVNIISKKHLLSKSKEIINQLEKIADKNNGVIRAKISSKIKLEQKAITEIEDFIKKRYKAQNTVLEFQINEKLLGGIKIEIGDEIIDTTLKNKIKKLQNYLITK